MQSQAAKDNSFDNPNDIQFEKNAHLVNPANAYEIIEGAVAYSIITANCEAKPTSSHVYELESSKDNH